MAELKKSIWITWETQRRNKELAKAFDADLKVFDHSNLTSLARYLKSTSQTLQVLKARPEFVFAQCPSFILCLLLALVKPFYGYTLIIDAHNALIRYLYSSGPIVSFLTKFFLKKADYVIVTNEGLTELIPVDASKILILPDKLPLININASTPKIFSKDKPNVVFISSFAGDEPILEFLKAAKDLTTGASFFVTGKKSKARQTELIFECPDIVFTDFLSEKNYENLIANADLTVDLTTLEDLLVCGAYETLSVGVPGILSDTKIQRTTFPEGFVFTECNEESIRESILFAIANLADLKQKVCEYKDGFVRKWESDFYKCRARIFN